MQGAKVVTLFNVKQEAYLSGQGSFVNDLLPDFLQYSKACPGKNKGFIIATDACLLIMYLTILHSWLPKKKAHQGSGTNST